VSVHFTASLTGSLAAGYGLIPWYKSKTASDHSIGCRRFGLCV